MHTTLTQSLCKMPCPTMHCNKLDLPFLVWSRLLMLSDCQKVIFTKINKMTLFIPLNQLSGSCCQPDFLQCSRTKQKRVKKISQRITSTGRGTCSNFQGCIFKIFWNLDALCILFGTSLFISQKVNLSSASMIELIQHN